MNSSAPSDLVARLCADDPPAFALLRRWNPATGDYRDVEVLIGAVSTVPSLADIPLPEGPGEPAPDALALVPFRQVRERGFACHDDGTPLQVLRVHECHRLRREELIAALPDCAVALRNGDFDIDDQSYEAIVKSVVHGEIASGAGANFVLRRDFTGWLPGFGAESALTLFRRLLTAERGAYWTFVVHTGRGGRTLVGASPEVHVRMDAGEVVMNPISGTYRYPASGPDRAGLLDFLRDPKEISELSMVLDEELKMMCAVGDRGGQVHGPYLREMAHLAHTEFEIRGSSGLDSRAVLRETMFAATVTGSPLENACRVIAEYETSGRGYYAGALALFGRDEQGAAQLDSPILIRAADVREDGFLRMPVGATLVRDSDPSSEVAETWAKAAGVLTALGVREQSAGARSKPGIGVWDDPEVTSLLARRRASLAPFWLKPSAPGWTQEQVGRALIIDTGDTFTAMLAHMLRSTGLRTAVARFDSPELPASLDDPGDLVVFGPGPGDPNDGDDPRMSALRDLAHRLFRAAVPLLGVCLGHQLLCRELGRARADVAGLDIKRKARPLQGAQHDVDLFGRTRTVGFYNSFVVHADDSALGALSAHGVEVSVDAGEVLALRGNRVAGVQFHPESVLTLDGPGALRDVLAPLLPAIRPEACG